MKIRVFVFMAFYLLGVNYSTIDAREAVEKKGKSKQDSIKNNGKIRPMDIKRAKEAAFVIEGKKHDIGSILKHLLEKNDQVQQVLYEAAMADSNYMKFQKKYAPFLSLSGNYTDSEMPEDLHRFSGTKLKERSGAIALSKGFSTGTTFTTGFQHTYSNSIDKNPQYGDIKYHQPVFFAKIEQELLKNFMGYQERRQNTMLKNADRMIKEISAYQISGIAVGSIIDSWNLALKAEEVSNSKMKLAETKRVRQIIRSNVSLGLNEKFDLNFWNALVAGQEAQLAQSNYTFNEIERKVRIDFDIQKDINLSGITVLSDVLPEIKLERALSIAYSNRADYQNALLAVKNARMQLEIYRNDAMPSLKGSFTVSSMGERDDLNEAMTDATAMDSPTYEASIEMVYPLYDSEQKANSRDALYKLKQAKIDLSNIKKNVRSDVENSIDGIKTAYSAYQKAKISSIESQRYYVRLRSYLRRGRFSASVVREALDAMVDSRQRELAALINYNASLLNFDIVQNQLFHKYDINIYKYIENKKKENN